MNANLQEKCQLFVDNKEMLQKCFRWEDRTMSLLASSIYTSANRRVNEERLKECEKILKKQTGVFSSFRGNLKTCLIVKMALSDDPIGFLEGVQAVYKMLKKGILDSERRILAAMSIYEHKGLEGAEYFVTKTNEIYKQMAKQHPFLTSEEDIPFAAILAISGKDSNALLSEAENCYSLLKKKFHSDNAAQSLSHIMALDVTQAQTKAERVVAIFDGLKACKKRYGKNHELATLGVLSMMDLNVESIVSEVSWVDDFLKQQKGIGGIFGIGRTIRLMYAALIVADIHMENDNMQGVVMSSTLTAVIAMEIAMMVIVTASVTTTATSSSH